MSALDRLLRHRLASGPLPAAEAMALALYHPECGYYRRAEGPWGFDGKDYYTALDVGPLLGEALAVRLEETWRALGAPSVFTVVEPGAGRGWLGRDLLAAASGAFARALVYIHRDDNPAARAAAETALAPWLAEGRARFSSEGEPLPAFIGAVVSNELFDALPAQPWRWDGRQWCFEALAAEGPAWLPGDPGEAGAWFLSQAGDGLRPGDGGTWCEGMAELVRQLVRALEAGLFLTLDYGDNAGRLVAKGAGLRRYRGHAVDEAWWEALGDCDVTADVDFTRLARLLEIEGLHEAAHHSLSHWIRAHAPLSEWEAQWQDLPVRERAGRTENLLQLTLPGMMGERYRVLEAWKPRR
ncbi:MAG TPA: SAM-dependent methyltransferase [Holophaga sp.]|nr:SAM-dependent methyltransferase [Holophaga sp.]